MARIQTNTALQTSLTQLWWRHGKATLTRVYQPIIDLAGQIPVEDLKQRVPTLLLRPPMHDYLDNLWISTGARFATDISNALATVARKISVFDFWEDYFRHYVRERTLYKLDLIMDTQAKMVNILIDSILEAALTEGASIDQIQRAMRTDLPDRLTEITKYEAERIARTEVIGASNTGSFISARDSGLDIRKIWSTCGLPGIRATHLDYEALGPQPMDYAYAPGLLYPGDPDGAAEEIINCRCTITYDVD